MRIGTCYILINNAIHIGTNNKCTSEEYNCAYFRECLHV